MRDKEFKLGNKLTEVYSETIFLLSSSSIWTFVFYRQAQFPKELLFFKPTVSFTKITQLSQEPLSLKYTSSFSRKDLEVFIPSLLHFRRLNSFSAHSGLLESVYNVSGCGRVASLFGLSVIWVINFSLLCECWRKH